MDYYPEDLLVGAFPLVFAVNAIHKESDETNRSLFDKLLDAVAASLVDNDELDDPLQSQGRPTRNIFQTADYVDNNDESTDEEFDRGRHFRTGALSAGLALGRLSLTRAISVGGHDRLSSQKESNATVLRESFFGRARIHTVSIKHGFPPSKDPLGMNNLAHAIGKSLQQKSLEKLKASFDKFPIDGILPSGWLEKHIHALPSVIMVICTVCGNQKAQDAQDAFLMQTVEHLQESLVPKRNCKIQIIGVMLDDVTTMQGETWLRTLSIQMTEGDTVPTNAEAPFNISLLRANPDLESTDTGSPTCPALRSLHSRIRQASISYYASQVSRVKKKLRILTENKSRRGQDEPPMVVLPLCVRFCWQLALFYEFQLKYEKSVQYWNEAYRHLSRYYLFLVELQSRSSDDKPHPPTLKKGSNLTTHALDNDLGDDSVEVALQEAFPPSSNSYSKSIWDQIPIKSPPDMIHQCRAVAERIHLKLLLMALTSHTDQGTSAAAAQIRQHSRIMMCHHTNLSHVSPAWYDFQYIARQKLVLSQLLERYPVPFNDMTHPENSNLLNCSTWRAFSSTAEAHLNIRNELKKDQSNSVSTKLQTKNDPMRARFLGCLDQETLQSEFQNETNVDHQQVALDYILKAKVIFEKELEEQKRGFYAEDEFSERISSRTGARLYYLAGGVLIAMNRHEQALGYLEKASKLSNGWRELELAVRRMLIGCYERHMPTSQSNESSQTLASMILDSYFNASMSSKGLRRALHHFATVSGGGDHLNWYHSAEDEDGTDLPISFYVTFPEAVFATVGDTIKASIHIQSNLDYAIHVNSVVLTSFAGELQVPMDDLMSAKNANEGVQGKGIIIQRKGEIQITTEVELPKSLSVIGADDSGNGGVMQATAGKGSFAKNARPRTSNITSAGGARLISEETTSKNNNLSQGWSLRFLGGKPLRYDGMNVIFYPVQVEKTAGGAESVTIIKLIVQKKKPKTQANIKRTPFEEENYIASAWTRPYRIPFSEGPRSIRVLGPQSQLTITNMTDYVTEGKALEGTVNRILLKLEAGPLEKCTNFQMQISHFSVLLLPSGATMRLVPEMDKTNETEGSVNGNDPIYRSPVLVQRDNKSQIAESSSCGYKLPVGWMQASNDLEKNLPSLDGGEATYIACDLYRPAFNYSDYVDGEGTSAITEVQDSICKTDIYVTLSYQQERPVTTTKQKRTRRPIRRRPLPKANESQEQKSSEETNVAEQETENEIADDRFDTVSLEYSYSVVWYSPLSAYFQTIQRENTSGKKHDTNRIDDQRSSQNSNTTEERLSMLDGETLSTRCSIAATHLISGLQIELKAVRFLNHYDNRCPVILSLGNSLPKGSDILYYGNETDCCRLLSQGSSFSVVAAISAKLKTINEPDNTDFRLGAVLVEWRPSAVPLPNEVDHVGSNLDDISGHGPLVLENASTIEFCGPYCCIDQSPFEAELVSVPVKPRVSIPFEVCFYVRNKTNLYQTLALDVANTSDEVVLLGPFCNTLQLEPYGNRQLKFSVLCLKAGLVPLPQVTVSSTRYNSWVIQDKNTSSGTSNLFVFP